MLIPRTGEFSSLRQNFNNNRRILSDDPLANRLMCLLKIIFGDPSISTPEEIIVNKATAISYRSSESSTPSILCSLCESSYGTFSGKRYICHLCCKDVCGGCRKSVIRGNEWNSVIRRTDDLLRSLKEHSFSSIQNRGNDDLLLKVNRLHNTREIIMDTQSVTVKVCDKCMKEYISMVLNSYPYYMSREIVDSGIAYLYTEFGIFKERSRRRMNNFIGIHASIELITNEYHTKGRVSLHPGDLRILQALLGDLDSIELSISQLEFDVDGTTMNLLKVGNHYNQILASLLVKRIKEFSEEKRILICSYSIKKQLVTNIVKNSLLIH